MLQTDHGGALLRHRDRSGSDGPSTQAHLLCGSGKHSSSSTLAIAETCALRPGLRGRQEQRAWVLQSCLKGSTLLCCGPHSAPCCPLVVWPWGGQALSNNGATQVMGGGCVCRQNACGCPHPGRWVLWRGGCVSRKIMHHPPGQVASLSDVRRCNELRARSGLHSRPTHIFTRVGLRTRGRAGLDLGLSPTVSANLACPHTTQWSATRGPSDPQPLSQRTSSAHPTRLNPAFQPVSTPDAGLDARKPVFSVDDTSFSRYAHRLHTHHRFTRFNIHRSRGHQARKCREPQTEAPVLSLALALAGMTSRSPSP